MMASLSPKEIQLSHQVRFFVPIYDVGSFYFRVSLFGCQENWGEMDMEGKESIFIELFSFCVGLFSVVLELSLMEIYFLEIYFFCLGKERVRDCVVEYLGYQIDSEGKQQRGYEYIDFLCLWGF